MSYPAWPDYTEEQWRAARVQSIAKFDEAKHPREPSGSSRGGEFAETGRSGRATSDPVLAAQATVGIAAVERLIPEALRTADLSELETPASWGKLSEATQNKVEERWKEQAYDDANQNVDRTSLDNEIRSEVQKDNQKILDAAVVDTIGTLKHVKPFKNTDQPTLPGEFDLYRTLDPETIQYGEGEHKDTGGWWPNGVKDDGGTVELDLEALRFTDGTPLTPEDRLVVREHWNAAYNDQYLSAVEKAFESDTYMERVGELENQYVLEGWDQLSDENKYEFAQDADLVDYRDIAKEEPHEWVTGVKTGDAEDDNYALTHAIANQLTVLRTDELRKERGLMGPGARPKYTIEDASIAAMHTMGTTLPEQKIFLIHDEKGTPIGSSNTLEQATLNAEQWADDQANAQANLKTTALVQAVWSNWKSSSSEGLSLSLQLAAARELGGLHRLTEDEVTEAEYAAKPYGGMANMQAYVRAQWEVTQMVMKKAGEDKLEVYRALMLPGESVKGTAHVPVDKFGDPITPPSNIREVNTGPKPVVMFDFAGEHFVAERLRPTTDIRNIPNPEADFGEVLRAIPPLESIDEAVRRRVEKFYDDVKWGGAGTTNLFMQLPDLRLQRAGAQSTTGTRTVANDWGGVGNLPDNPERVVLRIEAPATSALSLPVYGKNMQEEHETVLLGTKDKWLWDAWRQRAPDFSSHGVAPLVRKDDEFGRVS